MKSSGEAPPACCSCVVRGRGIGPSSPSSHYITSIFFPLPSPFVIFVSSCCFTRSSIRVLELLSFTISKSPPPCIMSVAVFTNVFFFFFSFFLFVFSSFSSLIFVFYPPVPIQSTFDYIHQSLMLFYSHSSPSTLFVLPLSLSTKCIYAPHLLSPFLVYPKSVIFPACYINPFFFI